MELGGWGSERVERVREQEYETGGFLPMVGGEVGSVLFSPSIPLAGLH